ncbi:MAG: hypothetical protein QG657_3574, partial [Acidobacteriota bacterium]|nr:hypothetical protein [Acidobacteriota bacterium]
KLRMIFQRYLTNVNKLGNRRENSPPLLGYQKATEKGLKIRREEDKKKKKQGGPDAPAYKRANTETRRFAPTTRAFVSLTVSRADCFTFFPR